MITGAELLAEAVVAISRRPVPNEAERRRAVSTAYYELFHTLTEAGALLIAPLQPKLRAKVARTLGDRWSRRG